MKQKNIFVIYALLMSTSLFGQTRVSEIPAKPDSIIYKQASEGALKMYFHYPEDWSASDLRPAIVFFFGGGWKGGNIEQFSRQATYLASRGMVSIRADYRVRSRHGVMPDKCVEDGKSAVRWIRAHAGSLGIDPDRIAGSGGSAGGHIAACATLVEGLEAIGEDHSISSRPDLMILYNPVMETTSERIIEMVGDEKMARLISPINWIEEGIPDGIMFFGTEDQLIEPAIRAKHKADSLGVQLELWTAKGQKHAFFNKSPWMEWTLYLTDQFLHQNGYLEGEPEFQLPDTVTMEQDHSL